MNRLKVMAAEIKPLYGTVFVNKTTDPYHYFTHDQFWLSSHGRVLSCAMLGCQLKRVRRYLSNFSIHRVYTCYA